MAQDTTEAGGAIAGHVKRAQTRIDQAIRGSSRQDVIIQAALGAVGVAVALRLLRVPGVGRLVSGVAPLLAAAAIFERSAHHRASS
ncbi:MAG: hypothetical protein HY925_16065 [Elusimicrobia bacterium]|nr:hypothetical protein [Elusimicrobiota bacterium]